MTACSHHPGVRDWRGWVGAVLGGREGESAARRHMLSQDGRAKEGSDFTVRSHSPGTS